jgi:hypothetical protein
LAFDPAALGQVGDKSFAEGDHLARNRVGSLNLDKALWFGWETLLRKYYHSDGVRLVWWPGRQHAYSPDFQRFLSGTKPPDELGNLNDLFDYTRPGA